MTSPIEDIILSQLAEVPAGKSIDPANVAKALDPDSWRRALGHVRGGAVGLARQGKIVILRHNKPADPGSFKGVYRLRLPMEGDVIPSSGGDVAVEDGGEE